MTRPSTPLGGSSVKVPSYERPLYDNFNKIYNHLLTLKNNRSKFINSKQIYQIYDLFLNYLIELKLTRKDEELKGITLSYSTIDSLVDDIWQLLSLCFVTCGLTKFAPATYSSLSAVHKLLDHLKECQVYTQQDLVPINSRLNEIKTIIDNNEQGDETLDDIFDDLLVEQEYLQRKNQNNIHKYEENLLLRNKFNKIEKLYNTLQNNFKNIPETLQYNYNQLVVLRKTLINLITNNEPINQPIIDQFKLQIKNLKNYEKVPTPNSEINYTAILDGLVDDVNNLLKDLIMKNNNDDLSEMFDRTLILDEDVNYIKQLDGLYNQLIDVRLKLENLLVTRRWTMRETDLYTYQKLLKNIDEHRKKINDDIEKQRELERDRDRDRDKEGDKEQAQHQQHQQQQQANGLSDSDMETISEVKPHDESKHALSFELTNKNLINPSLSTTSSTTSLSTFSKSTINPQQYLQKQQMLILYLLRRCYSLIYKLLESSEPVSESLAPIFNQLSTVKRCLLELKRVDGISNIRELFPFQMKLASLDNLRIDGKFLINGQIPEGQGTLNALLAECFDLIHELKIEMEDEDEDDDENEGVDEDNNHRQNIKQNHTITQTNDDTEVDVKRSRFKEFNAADYDLDSESAFDEDDDDEFESEEEEEDIQQHANDYY